MKVIVRDAEHDAFSALRLHRRQRHFAVVIEMAQANQTVARERLDQTEEAHADRMLRMAGVQGEDQRLIFGADRTDRHFAAVAQT